MNKHQQKKTPSKKKNPDKVSQGIEKLDTDLKYREEEIVKKEKEFKQRVSALEKKEKENLANLKKLEERESKLNNRELKLKEAEIKRDAGFAKEVGAHNEKMQKLKTTAEKELSDIRIKGNEELGKQIEKERKKRLGDLEKELQNVRTRAEIELDSKRTEFDKFKDSETNRLNEVKKEQDQTKTELSQQEDDVNIKKQRLDSKRRQLEAREKNIEDDISKRLMAREQSFNESEATFEKERKRLSDTIQRQTEIFNGYDELKKQLGGKDASQVLAELKDKAEENRILRNDLMNQPSKKMQETFNQLTQEKERLANERDSLQDENNLLKGSRIDQNKLELEIHDIKNHNKSLKSNIDLVEADNNRLMADLKRLQTSYERDIERDARIREIEIPYIVKETVLRDKGVSEIKWLDGIKKNCEDYGFAINSRILKSFHTALKTAEFSPLTILSGVSGTGKSELPRLYSYFGGINFLSLAVQPNWDSPESMLGFFNSIDNKFDAQPVLQLLAQTQRPKTSDYPGLQDTMTLILLDEMNLAHVELYFSEFLSKLESRRGQGKKDVPEIDVKLGAGIKPYKVPLGRNVLWTGTMNQDETTKSLSDKVLDRGIEIHFPRPANLKRRVKLTPLKKIVEDPILLRYSDWANWRKMESEFSTEEIKPYMAFIEQMNQSLANAGRALGHRVWQSIEYYMANYPDVQAARVGGSDKMLKKAMHISFEDQLVQKVMPKLRGIETRGKSKTECLDKIKQQLVDGEYSIIDDFDFACEFGYGQFMWNSAKYLEQQKGNKDDADDREVTSEND